MNLKLFRLLSLLPNNLEEFSDRASAIVEARWKGGGSRLPYYEALDFDHALLSLRERLRDDLTARLEEAPLARIEERVKQEAINLPSEAPFGVFHNADSALARICYAVCRATHPVVVLETGVAYGVTSAFLLQALHANHNGKLLSIDLPPLGLGGDKYVGALIPDELKNRWQLFRGSTKRVIPKLLPRLGQIDLFVHDSLHTYRNMKREFEQVWPLMKPGSVLIADDVEGNKAFEQFAETVRPAFSAILSGQSKNSLFGLIVK